MAIAKKTDNKKRDVLAELFAKRDLNVKEATAWPVWEIQEELERAEMAKVSFLAKDPMHDLSIIEEHISQLFESLKIKSTTEAES